MYVALKEPDTAIKLLERAMRTGRIDSEWLEHDATLAPLKGIPHFELLLARLKDPAA